MYPFGIECDPKSKRSSPSRWKSTQTRRSEFNVTVSIIRGPVITPVTQAVYQCISVNLCPKSTQHIKEMYCWNWLYPPRTSTDVISEKTWKVWNCEVELVINCLLQPSSMWMPLPRNFNARYKLSISSKIKWKDMKSTLWLFFKHIWYLSNYPDITKLI